MYCFDRNLFDSNVSNCKDVETILKYIRAQILYMDQINVDDLFQGNFKFLDIDPNKI